MSQKLKEFQLETKFRQIATITLQPFMNRLQQQIQRTINQAVISQALNNEMTALIKSSKLLMQCLDESKAQQIEMDKKMIKQESQINFLKQECQSIKAFYELKTVDVNKQFATKDRQIMQLTQQNKQLQGRIENIKNQVQQTTIIIQNKTTEGTDNCLNQILRLKNDHQRLERKQTELAMIVDSWKETSLSNFQNLKLYIKQRQEIQQRLVSLQTKTQTLLNPQQFEQYKRYLNLQLKITSQRLTRLINSILSPQVIQNLPRIINFSSKLNQIKEEQQISQIRLSQIFKDFCNKINGQMQFQQIRLSQSLSIQVESVLNNNKRQIYNTVVSQIPKQQKQNYQKLKQIPYSITKLKNEFQLQQINFNQIRDNVNMTLQNITSTLEKASQKITKIKSDIDIRSNKFEADVKHLIQLNEQYDRNLLKIGEIISQQSEAINILLASSLTHSKLQDNKVKDEIFATFNEGVICQIKDIPVDLICYRRKLVKKYDLFRATMFSYTKLIDQIHKQQFLGWNSYSPLQVYKTFKLQQACPTVRIQMNTMTKNSIHRLSETPEPKSSFLSQQGKKASISFSVQKLQLSQSKKKDNKPPTTARYQQFVSKTSRIRTRNLSRKPNV